MVQMVEKPEVIGRGLNRHSSLASVPKQCQVIEVNASLVPREPAKPGAMWKYQHVKLASLTRPTERPGPGMVLIEVLVVGICGSDVHALQQDAKGYSRFSGPASGWEFGQRFGHEVVGRVVACGKGVNIPLGTIVTADSVVACKTDGCQTCRSHLWNYCPSAYLIGFEAPGAFGEFVSLPAKCLHAIDNVIDGRGFEFGCRLSVLAEPLGVGLHAFDRADRMLEEDVERSALIHGGGMIGLAIAIRAKNRGYYPVIVSEPNPARAKRAQHFADYVFHPEDLECEALFNAYGVYGPAIVAEASGVVEIESAVSQVIRGGVVVTVARTGQRFCVESDLMITGGKVVMGARGHVGRVEAALNLLANPNFPAEQLISRELHGLDELHLALQHPDSFGDDTKVICRVA